MRQQRLKIAIFMVAHTIGGSQKRFANLFSYLRSNGNHDYYLFTNRYLYDQLVEMNILDRGIGNVELLLTRNILNLTDRPALNVRTFGGTRVKGLNIPRNLLQRFEFLIEKGRHSHMEFDVAHFVFAMRSKDVIRYKAMVLECQSAGLEHDDWRKRHFRDLLGKAQRVNIASERIKNTLESLSNTRDGSKYRVNPCSFVDYSKCVVKDKEPNIVFCGSLISIKKPLLFVDAIGRLRDMTDLRFKAFLLGRGPMERDVRNRIKELGLGGIVENMFHPRPTEILSRSLIFASLQSLDNYHSQALMEAMACGCAVVASDVGETWRLVDENVGFRVPLDVNRIADRMLFMLEHPDMAERLGRNAREKVMKEQRLDIFAEYMEKLYEEALHDAPQRQQGSVKA
jgi:glycosyltransferase involved in cell wall biosynthesis